MTDWDDLDIDDYEYINWESLPSGIKLLSDIIDREESKYLIVEPLYDTIEEFKNAWNKTQLRIIVKKIINLGDDWFYDGEYYLGMGKRLFNQMKIAKNSKWKHIEIVRTGKKYETQYAVRQLKLAKQTKINDKPKLW